MSTTVFTVEIGVAPIAWNRMAVASVLMFVAIVVPNATIDNHATIAS